MSEENSSSSIDSFFESEISRLEKSNRNWTIGGILILLFITSYLTLLLVMARTFLDPRNAALLISAKVEENAPEFLFQSEQALRKKAPALAAQMSETFLAAIPEFRVAAQNQLELTHQQMIPHLSEEFQSIINTYVDDNREWLEALADGNDIDNFADTFTSDVMDRLGKSLEAELMENYEGRDYIYFQHNMLFALEAMNAHLEELIAADATEQDRRTVLQRRILSALTQRLIENMPGEY